MRKSYPVYVTPARRNPNVDPNNNNIPITPDAMPNLTEFIINTPVSTSPFEGQTISQKRYKKYGEGTIPTDPIINVKIGADPREVEVHNGVTHDLDIEAIFCMWEYVRDKTTIMEQPEMDIDALLAEKWPQNVVDQLNREVTVTIEDQCKPKNNPQPVPKAPVFSHVRNYMVHDAPTTTLLYDCNKKDLEVFHTKNTAHTSFYCAYDVDASPTSILGAANYKTVYTNELREDHHRWFKRINLYYFISKYCESYDRLCKYLDYFSDALANDGSMYLILPHPDSSNPRSVLHNLVMAQERGTYPRMTNVDQTQAVFSDYYIPLEDIASAALATGLHMAVVSHDIIQSSPAEAASCSLIHLTRIRHSAPTVEDQVEFSEPWIPEDEITIEEAKVTEEEATVLRKQHHADVEELAAYEEPSGALKGSTMLGQYEYTLLDVREIANMPMNIHTQLLQRGMQHDLKQEHLRHTDFSDLTVPRLVFTTIPFGVPGLIYNIGEYSVFYSLVDKRIFQIQPPIFSKQLWHVVAQPLDGELSVTSFSKHRPFKIIIMDTNFAGGLVDRLENIAIPNNPLHPNLQKAEYLPLSKLPAKLTNHIVIHDLSHRYCKRIRSEEGVRIGRTGYIVLRGAIVKVDDSAVPNYGDNRAIRDKHKQKEWHLDCDGRILFSPHLHMPSTHPTGSQYGKRRLIFPDTGLTTQPIGSLKLDNMIRDLKAFHTELNPDKYTVVEDTRLEDLRIYAIRESTILERSTDRFKTLAPPLEFFVEDLFPNTTTLAAILQDISNMDKLVSTYPHLLSWRKPPSSDALAKLYLIRHARLRMLPPGNLVLQSLMDKAIGFARDLAKKKIVPQATKVWVPVSTDMDHST